LQIPIHRICKPSISFFGFNTSWQIAKIDEIWKDTETSWLQRANASRPVQAAIVHALQEAREGTDKEMRKTVLFNTIVFAVD